MPWHANLRRYRRVINALIWGTCPFIALTLVILAAVQSSGLYVAFAVKWLILCAAMHFWIRSMCGLGRAVKRHLRIGSGSDGSALFHEVRARDRANLQLALDALHAREPAAEEVLGVPTVDRNRFIMPFDPLASGVTALIDMNPLPASLQWDAVPRSLTETMNCGRNPLYLLQVNGQPFCAMMQPPPDPYRLVFRLEIFAASRATAQAALDLVLRTAREVNIYRRAFIAFEPPAYHEDRFDVVFHAIPTVQREEIILPESLLKMLERNTMQFLVQQEALRRAGQRTQRGLLFHGSPGVGKTLVIKYLASASKCTVIVLSGPNMGFIREACQYARLLAPCIVVLEDVDLIALDRADVINNSALHQLMESMDGLGPHSDCVFILTTNRPESLEKALAERPGRVDQAIHFPLPARDERRRLFARFGAGLDLTALQIDALLNRTDGATPAFIQELVRKAALLAIERGEASKPLRLQDGDFSEAMNEIVLFGGELTRRILGFQPATPGTQPLR